MKNKALGIPEDIIQDLPEIKEPEPWEFSVQEHQARKAGKHYDIRLGDPRTGMAHSWAVRELPKPGEKRFAAQQPTHTIDYMDYKGKLGPGYGEGKVDLKERETVEVVRGTPDKIHFNVYKAKGPEEFSFIRMKDKDWLLLNRTIARQRVPGLPSDKPSYKELKTNKIDFDNPDEILQAKIDGAHNLIVFPRWGLYPKIVSYRPGKKSGTGVIEHTHKIPGAMAQPIPKNLKDTIVRGEIFAMGPDRKAALSSDIGGLLNSAVWKSRINQKAKKTPLKPVIFDIVRFKGKDVESKPYAEKLKMLQEVVDSVDILELPPMAKTPEEKRRLFEAIKKGMLPETKEGVVAWNLKNPAPPLKFKLKDEYDVFVRGFFDAKPGTKYEGNAVGGFAYSHDSSGPIVGRVGTGLTDKLRRKMYQNPDKYIGSIAKVQAQGTFISNEPDSQKDDEGDQKPAKGSLRAPSFQEWHLDKNDVEFLKSASARIFGHMIDLMIKDF